jgi:hypothetical protein
MPPVGSGTCARSMHGAGIGVSCAAGGPA